MVGYKVDLEALQTLLGDELDEYELVEVEFLESFHACESTALAERLSDYFKLPYTEVYKILN